MKSIPAFLFRDFAMWLNENVKICAAALGLRNPRRVSPQSLFDVVTWKKDGARTIG